MIQSYKCVFALILFSKLVFAQTSQPVPPNQSPSQAQTLISQAISASFGLVSVSDMTLTGTVASHFGTDDSGNFTLQANSSGAAKIKMSLGSGSRTELNTPWGADPGCTWSGADAATHKLAIHSCWTLGSWFFPLLPLTQSQPNLLTAYVGSETRNSVAVQHLVIGRNYTSIVPETDNLINNLSTGQIYLDASTYLPTTYTFNSHPDKDAGTNIPVEIRYSDYRATNGVKVPFHIQKLMNGTIVLDFTVSSAVFNTGVQIQ